MNAKEDQTISVYKELITVEVAAEKIAGTDDIDAYLTNIENRLKEKEEFEGAEYDRVNGNTLVIKTKENYEFAVVGDKVILANDNKNPGGSSDTGSTDTSGGGGGTGTELPEIKEGEVKFKTIPNYWVNTSVSLEISNLKHPTWSIEHTYDYNAEEWTAYNGKVVIDSNKKIYVRLRNDEGVSKTYSTHSVTNIDKTAPKLIAQSFKIVDESVNTRSFTVELKAEDTESGISQIVWSYKLKSDTKWTKSVTDVYHTIHTKDAGEKQVTKTHKFDKLKSGIYQVQANVYDVAGNITPTDPIEVTIGKIDDVAAGDIGQGNLTYSPHGWTNGNVTVNLPVIPNFETRYTTDGSVPNVSSTKYDQTNPIVVPQNTRIYYIYTDGVNISKYATKEVTNIDKDKMAIRTALKEDNITTNSFDLSIQVEDEPTAIAGRSGLAQIDWYYKLNTSSDEYQVVTDIYHDKYTEKSGVTGRTTKTKSLTGLSYGTYSVYVEVHDVAGNVTSTKDTPITVELGQITQIAEKNASYAPTYWTNGDVTVTLPKTEGFPTKYILGSGTPSATNPNLKEYIDPFKVEANTTVKFFYSDGVNISNVGTKNITNIDKTPASITNFAQSNVTTNGFKLSANIQDSESGIGKVVFYYKHQNDSTYTSKVWSNPERLALREAPAIQSGPTNLITVEETFTNLTSGAYECYVQVFNTAGTETSTMSNAISFSLGSIPTIGSSSFSPSGWTNGDVTVTLPTSNGFTTRYTIGGTPLLTSTIYTSPFTVSGNGTVKYIYTDGTNINTAGSRTITNIDKKVPDITTALNKTNVTTKGFTLTMSVQDTDTTVVNASGLSKIIWYYRVKNTGNYTALTTAYKDMNGTENGSRDVTNASKAIDNLTSGTYEAYAVVYDVAGNTTTSSTIEITLESLPTIGSSSFSPSGWTNGNVTVTLPTATGYTTRYTTDGSTPTKTSTAYNTTNKVVVSSNNTTVKYVYTDGTNINTAGSRAITNIDKTVPTVSSALAQSTKTHNSIKVKITVQDSNSGLGKIVWYYKTSSDSSWSSETSTYTTLNGATSGTTTSTVKEYNFTGLSSNTNYEFYAIVYDVAGNAVTSESSSSPLTIKTDPALVTSISLSTKQAIIGVNKTTTVTATVSPSTAANKEVTWAISGSGSTITSSTTSSATVKGVTEFTKVTLTATAKDGSGKTASCTVSVPKNFAYTGNIQSFTLPAGKYKLEVWGAQGGNGSEHYGYISGYDTLYEGRKGCI